jgi:predicted ATPase with chaperone activity
VNPVGDGLNGKALVSGETGIGSVGIAAPRTLQDLGIRKSLVEDLVLKILYLQGELHMLNLASHMRLNFAIVNEVFEHLRQEQFCEIKGMMGNVYRIKITALGKERALELLELSHYAGPAPVSLDDYMRQVRAQSIRNVAFHAADLKGAFSHLVLRPETLTQLGAAIFSGRSILLHGPSGSGKTAIAETIAAIHRDYVWIPYAVEVGSQIITVFDPYLHEPSDEPIEDQTDRRWVRCRRPRVVAGGDLRLEMLELQFNPVGRYYSAPLQMKANNGVLIVDDFGRQQAHLEDLLNRCMSPLDREIDFLTLVGGRRFSVPFDLFVVFATNLDPQKVADEAFLRRIHTKVKLSDATAEEFHEIFRRACVESDLVYDAAVVDELVASLERSGRPLRPCDPGEIAQQICRAARYERKPPRLDSASVVQACHNCFLSA